MFNQNLLLRNNELTHNFNNRRIRFVNGKAVFKINCDEFTGNQLLELINFINFMLDKYSANKMPIEIELGKFQFHDKLVYILLECLCNYIITERKQKLTIKFFAEHTIWSEGIQYSPLRFINGEKLGLEKFAKEFNFNIDDRHYRRVIPQAIKEKKPEYLSILMNDIFCFLQNNYIEETACRDLAEVVSELVGNAIDHSDSDCLVDLDISSEYINRHTNNYCHGLNLCVLNFSSNLFYELLKDKISMQKNLPERYDTIIEARRYHSALYSNNYTEEDFFMVASFQHKISGSEKKIHTGGTGLTSLIESLEERAEGHWCYILTGNRVMFLRPEHMIYDENKLIGFNQERNFMNEIPDINIFETISTYLPGTAYNLNFALKKGEG